MVKGTLLERPGNENPQMVLIWSYEGHPRQARWASQFLNRKKLLLRVAGGQGEDSKTDGEHTDDLRTQVCVAAPEL